MWNISYNFFDNRMIQEVAFGTRKLKFDRGEAKEVLWANLSCKYSHAIAAYIESCKVNGYEALRKSSLWRILHEVKPSQQQSLAGLHDILKTGMNVFQMLLDHAKKFPQSDKTTKALENGKWYLKIKYPLYCTNGSPVKTHNKFHIVWSQEQNASAVLNYKKKLMLLEW